jgi:hypothetical protein
MGERVLPGLIQKAKLDAEALPLRMTINAAGQIRKRGPRGWIRAGDLPDRQDREDFLVAQLTQEER